MRLTFSPSRDAFLYATLLWLALAAVVAQNIFAFVFVLVFALIAMVLYSFAAPGSPQSTSAAYGLVVGALTASGITALVVVNRLGWLGDVNPYNAAAIAFGAVLVSWLLATATAIWFYGRLIAVPDGVMYIYTGFLGPRTVKGFTRFIPPSSRFWPLRAMVPLRQLKLDIDVSEIGTLQRTTPRRLPRYHGTNGPPKRDGEAGIDNIHRLELSAVCAIEPDHWRNLLKIPSDGLVGQLQKQYGGRSAWREQEFWSKIVGAYVKEIAEEQTRRVIYESGWSPLNVWQQQDVIADRIFERLVTEASEYGVQVHSLDIIEVAVDEPGAMRRKRDLTLLSETWQQQQSRLLESFQASLSRLGLQLTPKEIEQITRTHLLDLVRDLQHYGHLDYIVGELVADTTLSPTNGGQHGGHSPLRKIA